MPRVLTFLLFHLEKKIKKKKIKFKKREKEGGSSARSCPQAPKVFVNILYVLVHTI